MRLCIGDKYYAYEKFGTSVRHLAVHDGPRRELMLETYRCFSAVGEADMPSDCDAADDFRSLMTRMTSAGDTTGQGTVLATLATMSDDEACAIAGLILDIYSTLANAIISAQRNGEHWGRHHGAS